MGNGCRGLLCGRHQNAIPLEKETIFYKSMSPDKWDRLESPYTTTDFKRIRPSDFIMKKLGSIRKDYKISRSHLGKGAYGEVRKAIHRLTGLPRAIKIITKDELSESERQRMATEVEILKQIDHPNIIKIFEFYEDEAYFYIVSELCTGGELFDRIAYEARLCESEAAIIMKQVLSAVFYCHKNKIVHRDLKPENILYLNDSSEAPLKIIDFGTSKTFVPNEVMNQKFGTPYYIAPEVLKKHYDEKCDIWSCGVILYVILSGRPPFSGADEKEIMKNVERGTFKMDIPEFEDISSEAKSLILSMMAYDANKRVTAEEALNSEWIRDMGQSNHINLQLAKQTLLNLRKFRVQHKLQHAIWVFIVQNVANSEEKVKLMSIFKELDKDGDGLLTREDIVLGYRTIFKVEDPGDIVNKIMNRVDSDNSGTIDYMEFLMGTMNKKKILSKKILEKAFKMLDKDDSGYITKEELIDTFQSIKVGPEKWAALIKQIDGNGDGKISLQEFKDMMLKYAESFE